MFPHTRLACVFRSWGGRLKSIGFVAIAVLAFGHGAAAHGIVGNRVFPGTISMDDPAVADEFALTTSSGSRPAADQSSVTDNNLSWSFTRLLTPTLAVGIASGFAHRNWGDLQRYGYDTTTLTLKGLVYKNEQHEFMLSAGLSWAMGGSGARGIGAGGPDTIQPGLFFGKGFGDLPSELAWLRPFGVSGAVAVHVPLNSVSTIVGLNESHQLVPMLNQNVETLHWGFSFQYSTYYLTPRFTGGPPKQEPVNQFIPLVELAFETPRGQKTAGTINPGLAYVGSTFQVAGEAIVPLNSEGGHHVGFRAQILLFLDDLAPQLFGKPLLMR